MRFLGNFIFTIIYYYLKLKMRLFPNSANAKRQFAKHFYVEENSEEVEWDESPKTDYLSDYKEKRKEIRSEELGTDYVLEKIDELAEKLLLDKKEEVNDQAKSIGKKLTLNEMQRAVDIYLHNAVDMYPESMNLKRMGVVIRYCVAFGEEICDYLDKTAFGDYDWTQYEAIDLLCRLALIQGIRKKKTLELIDEHIDTFRYTSLMNTLQSIKYFENEPIVQKIFERQIEKAKEDYQELVNILEMYGYWNLSRFRQYLPVLKKIVIESNENDYSTFLMSYNMRGNENGEMIGYNQDGSVYNEDEGVEGIKLKAGIMFYKTDKTDAEINNYLTYIKLHSKFENHKSYLMNSIEI